ncbi:hypothetical protein E2C01_083833 [Portunus trituberculatus]|uniref:Uncharacterized protein n=1 Tax=Portunus trituberculatus TaxID=210409 RepID=A0A5B7J2P0_PORTR|nr:hypothetical protein [Portunus trituberculatus]
MSAQCRNSSCNLNPGTVEVMHPVPHNLTLSYLSPSKSLTPSEVGQQREQETEIFTLYRKLIES